MQRFLDLTLNGIANGAVYAAVALSLVLIWRATRILNFAQAGMLMFTTFIAWAAIDARRVLLGRLRRRRSLAGSCSARSSSASSSAPSRARRRSTRSSSRSALLVLLQAVAGMIWGGNPRSFPPRLLDQGLRGRRHAVLFSPFDLFTVVVVGGR